MPRAAVSLVAHIAIIPVGHSCICIFCPVSTAPSSSFAFFHGGLSDKAQYLRRRNRIIVDSVQRRSTETRYQERQGDKMKIGSGTRLYPCGTRDIDIASLQGKRSARGRP